GRLAPHLLEYAVADGAGGHLAQDQVDEEGDESAAAYDGSSHMQGAIDRGGVRRHRGRAIDQLIDERRESHDQRDDPEGDGVFRQDLEALPQHAPDAELHCDRRGHVLLPPGRLEAGRFRAKMPKPLARLNRGRPVRLPGARATTWGRPYYFRLLCGS